MRLRVLILDDSVEDAELMALELARAGIAADCRRVETEADYLAALEEGADVVLSDHKLPGYSAPDALARLKALGLDIPFIVVSGAIDERTAVQLIRDGAADYLLKDRLVRLGPAVQAALEQRALRAARRRAEEALRESEERYRLITEHVGDGIFLADNDGRLVLANGRAGAMSGYTVEECRGRSLLDLLTPESARLARERLDAARAGRAVAPVFEAEMVRRDGTRLWVEASIVPVLRDGVPVGRLGVVRDITQRREAEARLRLLATALEAAANGIAITDVAGTLVWANDAFCRMTGHGRHEVIGRNMRILKSGRTPRETYEVLWRTILAGRVWAGELVNRRKDGSLYTDETTITPVPGPGGAIAHFIAVKQDVTQERTLQVRMMQAEKLAAMGELIAGIAHELNNPLAVVVGYSQLLAAAPGAGDLAVRAGKIAEAAQRAARIVRNFLAFARRQAPERAAVDLNQVVRQTLDVLAYQLRVANITVETALAADLPAISADAHELQQALLNLCNNALQAMADTRGRGTLSVTTAHDAAAGLVLVSVADDGGGIAPGVLERLGEPFLTTKPAGRGTGLGLAIVKSIVAQHGGDLRVANRPGEGATFTVVLPVTPPPAPRAEAPAPEVPAGRRALVVDDEPGVREVLVEALGAIGLGVDAVGTGEDALAFLGRAEPDVVLLDLRMPGMSGRQLWTEIGRRWPATARRVVFCTGVVDEADREFLEGTGQPVLAKPFQWPALREALARVSAR